MLQKAKCNLVTHHKKRKKKTRKKEKKEEKTGKGGGEGCGGLGVGVGAQRTLSFSDLVRSFKRSLLGSRIPVREGFGQRPGR